MEHLSDIYIKKPEYVVNLLNSDVTISLKIDGTAFQIYCNPETKEIEYHKRSGNTIKLGPIIDDTNRIINKTYNNAIKKFDNKKDIDIISKYKFLAMEIFNGMYVLLNVVSKDDKIIEDEKIIKSIAKELSIETVPILYKGTLSKSLQQDIINLFSLSIETTNEDYVSYLMKIFGNGDYKKFLKDGSNIEGIVLSFKDGDKQIQYKIVNPSFRVSHKIKTDEQSIKFQQYQETLYNMYELLIELLNNSVEKLDDNNSISLQKNFLKITKLPKFNDVLKLASKLPENKFDFKDLQYDRLIPELVTYIRKNGKDSKTALEEYIHAFHKIKTKCPIINKDFQNRINKILEIMYGIKKPMVSLKEYIKHIYH